MHKILLLCFFLLLTTAASANSNQMSAKNSLAMQDPTTLCGTVFRDEGSSKSTLALEVATERKIDCNQVASNMIKKQLKTAPVAPLCFMATNRMKSESDVSIRKSTGLDLAGFLAIVDNEVTSRGIDCNTLFKK